MCRILVEYIFILSVKSDEKQHDKFTSFVIFELSRVK